jgi:hypothetical protein
LVARQLVGAVVAALAPLSLAFPAKRIVEAACGKQAQVWNLDRETGLPDTAHPRWAHDQPNAAGTPAEGPRERALSPGPDRRRPPAGIAPQAGRSPASLSRRSASRSRAAS